MDEFEIRRIIMDYIKEICHYSQLQVFATSYYQKNYFQLQIEEAINGLINFFITYNEGLSGEEIPYVQEQELTRERQEEQDQNQQELIDNSQNQEAEDVPEEQDQQGEDIEVRNFTPEELAIYNGNNGKPAYVAVDGIVYDVSAKARWAGGMHFGLNAGQDLSAQFQGCHQGFIQVLNILPKVGVLINQEDTNAG